MKVIWYLSSVLTILLILISNPKASSLGNLGNNYTLFSYTKSTQINIQLMTIVVALIFLFLTIILTSHFSI